MPSVLISLPLKFIMIYSHNCNIHVLMFVLVVGADSKWIMITKYDVGKFRENS